MPSIAALIASQLRQVHFGGNWSTSSLKEHLTGVTLAQARHKIDGFNTILTLAYHIHYYVHVTIPVLRGGALVAKDVWSFDHPDLQTEPAWQAFLETVWAEAETLASLVEQLPDARLTETFVDEKYGTLYRNMTGIIEHCHYHLGQIVLLKKMSS